MKIITQSLFVLLLSYTFVACGPAADETAKNLPPYGGSWKQVTERGQEVIYTFEADNRYSKQAGGKLARGKYKLEGNQLTLTPRVGRESTLTNFVLEGDTLSWTLPTGTRVQLQKYTPPKEEN